MSICAYIHICITVQSLVLGDISIILKYHNINKDDNYIIRTIIRQEKKGSYSYICNSSNVQHMVSCMDSYICKFLSGKMLTLVQCNVAVRKYQNCAYSTALDQRCEYSQVASAQHASTFQVILQVHILVSFTLTSYLHTHVYSYLASYHSYILLIECIT